MCCNWICFGGAPTPNTYAKKYFGSGANRGFAPLPLEAEEQSDKRCRWRKEIHQELDAFWSLCICIFAPESFINREWFIILKFVSFCTKLKADTMLEDQGSFENIPKLHGIGFRRKENLLLVRNGNWLWISTSVPRNLCWTRQVARELVSKRFFPLVCQSEPWRSWRKSVQALLRCL